MDPTGQLLLRSRRRSLAATDPAALSALLHLAQSKGTRK